MTRQSLLKQDETEARRRLVAMRDRIRERLDDTESSISNSVLAPGDDSSVSNHPADIDSERVGSHVEIARSGKSTLAAIEDALTRLEQGAYGTCIECGKGIDAERLEALAHATHCVPCARRLESPRPG